MPIVKMPDGTNVQFPDDMPADQIKSLISQKFSDAGKSGGSPLSSVPVLGAIDAATTGVGQGITAGFEDEAMSALASPFRAGYRAVIGEDEGKSIPDRLLDAYHTELSTQRKILHQAEQEHPGATAAGEAAGALTVLPQGGAATTIPRAMARGAAEGSAYGAASGFGSGEGAENRIIGSAVGAGVGGAAGAALPPLAAGTSYVGNKVAETVVPTLHGVFNVENAAARQIRNALMTDRPQIPAQDFAAARNRGQPVANIDIGGERTRSLARTAADLSPEARDALNQTINSRFESQGDRIGQFLKNLVPGSDKGAATEALQVQAEKANKPAYQALYKAGDKPIVSDELNRLAGSRVVQQAMKNVVQGAGRDRAIAQGLGGFNPGAQVTQDGRVVFTKGKNGVPAYPNIQFWDYVQREAGRIAKQGEGGVDPAAGFKIVSDLKNELDKLVPGYKSVRQGAASFFQADNALDAGANFAKQNFDIRDASRAFSKFSAPEKELAAQGFTSEVLHRIGTTNYRADVVRRIWGSPDARAKFQLMLGPQRAKQLEAFMNIESAMNLPREAVQGNSRTAQFLAAMGLGASVQGLYSGRLSWDSLYAGLIGGAAKVGLKGVDRKVAQRIGEMLASDNPKLFMQGVNLVSKRPAIMNVFRRAVGAMGSGPLAAIAAQQASGLASH